MCISIVGYGAQIVIQIVVVDGASASPGAGSQRRRRRRRAAPLSHDSKRR